jgi:hypothetical protein
MVNRFRGLINPNPTLFRSWHWQSDISKEGAGSRVRLVQLSLKVMGEASSPSTGEKRGALIFCPLTLALSRQGDCVAILKPHECHSEPQAKNLTIPASYKKQILRLAPQDDIATQSQGEREPVSLHHSRTEIKPNILPD